MQPSIEKIFINGFDYPLPDERIAKYPLAERDASKLLVYKNKNITESVFRNIDHFIPGKSLLVYNNTRVIQARLHFKKETGATIEVFCLEPVEPADYSLSLSATGNCVWECMIGNLKKWKEGILSCPVTSGDYTFNFKAELLSTEGNTHLVRFSWDNDKIHFAGILESAGELPIPPYLHRKTEDADTITYQTVYSKIKGSVAAPTAGLHFTEQVFERLGKKSITTAEVTLHVGAGTFQPVKTDKISEHTMHSEVISVSKTTIEQLRANLGNIVAVGTTTVRTLESLYHIGVQLYKNPETTAPFKVSQWEPYSGNADVTASDALSNIIGYLDKNNISSLLAQTRIMIAPGYTFRIVDGMITNFHQPKSTLLLLVSAFTGGNWNLIYDYALSHDFRFLSYGDSSLLWKEE